MTTRDSHSSRTPLRFGVATRLLSLGLAGGLALLPTTGLAAPSAAPPPTEDVTPPEPAPEPAPAPDAPAEPPAEPTDVTSPAEPTEPTEPTEPDAPALPEQPEAPAEPEPPASPEPPSVPAPVVTTPEAPPPAYDPSFDPGKARRLRLGGAYTMIGGGGIALAGLALAIGFTVKGNRNENQRLEIEDSLFNNDCNTSSSSTCDGIRSDLDAKQDEIDGANRAARVGGILLLGGAVAAIVGGVVYRRGVKLEEKARSAKIRVSPTLGGAVISGRF